MSRSGWKKWNVILKVLIFIFLCWAIYRQVFAKSQATDIWQSFRQRLVSEQVIWLLLNVLLIPVNWLLEALKWQQLLKGFSNYPFTKSYRLFWRGSP
ncbi:MAG: hypothetical protein HC892_05010 [Saprospiraceae bacterium]|nr:hypothetical protein [Saprospiraceae bacterium]